MSVMEMSHRGADYMQIHAQTKQHLRQLLNLSDDYEILFLQGGGHLQFAMLPLNLMQAGDTAGYITTGVWSEKGLEEAQKIAPQYGLNVIEIASSANSQCTDLPNLAELTIDPSLAYVHLCHNETINGVECTTLPNMNGVALVVDMSSNFLSQPMDVNQFGVIYACAQKNIGIAGLAVVIIRKDLLQRPHCAVPSMLDYAIHAAQDSMYNTPPTYAIYMAGLMFEWLIEQGGLAVIGERNAAKAKRLYDYIDGSGFYRNSIAVACRSRMNVPFTLLDAGLDVPFLAQAQAEGLTQLKGHRLLGGMRASIYNAMPMAGVEALIAFMQRFAKTFE
jgi:phosphoserine aminotransferase